MATQGRRSIVGGLLCVVWGSLAYAQEPPVFDEGLPLFAPPSETAFAEMEGDQEWELEVQVIAIELGRAELRVAELIERWRLHRMPEVLREIASSHVHTPSCGHIYESAYADIGLVAWDRDRGEAIRQLWERLEAVSRRIEVLERMLEG